MPDYRYCESLTQFKRLKTPTVSIGGILLGKEYPVRVQTMATTSTNDTLLTVNQCIRAVEAGAELFRITAPSIKEAKNLEAIKRELLKKGFSVPLVADIHFNPDVALEAVMFVEKVRINPGNYADPRAKFQKVDYSDKEYAEELLKVQERFIPLLDLCRKRGVAIRIGVNHGSLSDRIMSRYGDTPEGMVESAMEFISICHRQNFKNVVISMKASNTRVMVQSTRLLVNRMLAENIVYPLHLGVTEAGEGEDGRIKSAVGIGSLLADGIGDTIRVSLTEEPEIEIPVAKKLTGYFEKRITSPSIPEINELPYNPFSYNRRKTKKIDEIGSTTPPVVIANLSKFDKIGYSDLLDWGWSFDVSEKKWSRNEQAADKFYFGKRDIALIECKEQLPIISINNNSDYVFVDQNSLTIDKIQWLKANPNLILVLSTLNTNGYADQRSVFIRLMNAGIENPVVIERDYSDVDVELFQLKSSADIGALMIDGLGDGVMITAQNIPSKVICTTSFSILQASRTRTTRTEFISCPGCGRTLFNLQETVAKIKEATSHLKGLKIGIMGCIVNGPGEMADADYGYVGMGNGRVSLYKGKIIMKKSIPENIAVEELIKLIKENGDWREKRVVS
ncbi:MAG TPA: 4-hydroxy-3-methylbut-2-en-1-yl diphosphate synthase [Bacteroidales bacterium]|nr:4-hydroxy-3-methylbut-2-en-1-yl diphosphate synthase [Bacteroidales bacterium]